MDGEQSEQIAHITAVLADAGVESAAFDARMLVGAASTTNADAQLDDWVAKRAMRVPLQLLIGHTGFRMIDVTCQPGVFIPRPETEILVGVVLDEIAEKQHPLVIEPCTGTGAISASLLAEHDTVEVVATDVNAKAVAVARHNMHQVKAGMAGVPPRPDTARAQVVCGSLFEPVPSRFARQTDVVVCNPPYLPEHMFATLPPEVHDHDPHAALVGGEDGHEIVSQIFSEAPMWLCQGGLVAVEVDATRIDHACELAQASGLHEVDTVPDLTGTHRFVIARCR